MAAYYFKVPPHLAKEMGILNDPTKKLKDGNYIAFYTHMEKYCSTYEAVEKAESMGCLALRPREMREEIDGKVNRDMPTPTDPRFFPPTPIESANDTQGEIVAEEGEIAEDNTSENEEDFVNLIEESDSNTEVVLTIVEEEEEPNEEGSK